MNKILKKVILISFLFLILPFGVQADDESNLGKITINVRDENNNAYVGNWFLYSGINNKGMLTRNGSSGETFNFKAGTYFIEIQPKDNIHPYRLVTSANPQTLIAGGAITFDVQYFQTEEQKNSPQMPELAIETPIEAPILIVPIPTIEEITGEETDDDVSASNEDEYDRTYMGPEITVISMPAQTETISAEVNETEAPVELAKTGSPLLLLLAFSGLLGGIVTRKKE